MATRDSARSARIRRGGKTAAAMLAVGIVAVSTGQFAGCGKSGGGNTVVFWEFWPREQIQPVLDDFKKAHPEITVEVQQLTWSDGPQKITAAVASGTVPDLCELGSTQFAQYASAGALRDLTPLADSLRDQYRAWDMVTYQQHVFGLPWVVGSRALYYNKVLFARAGLDSTKAPETWSEFADAAAKVQALGGDIHGNALNAGERLIFVKKFMPFAWGNGGDVLSSDNTRSLVNSQQNLDALKFYLSLKPSSMVQRQEILDQAFMEGKIGMNLSGPWLLNKIPTDAPNLRYGVGLVPRPNSPDGTHASFMGGELLVFFAKAKPNPAAMTLARFLISAEAAGKIAHAARFVAANVGAENDPYYTTHPEEGVFARQMATARALPAVPQWGDIEDALTTSLDEAILGSTPAEDALRNADEKIAAILHNASASSNVGAVTPKRGAAPATAAAGVRNGQVATSR